MDIQFFQHCLLKKLSFPHFVFLVPLSKMSWPHMCEFCFWVLYTVSLACLSNPAQSHTGLITNVICWVLLLIRSSLPDLFLFLRSFYQMFPFDSQMCLWISWSHSITDGQNTNLKIFEFNYSMYQVMENWHFSFTVSSNPLKWYIFSNLYRY